ncbi:MAG TPA: VOC family protein [Tepidiformaceae bacterium]|nr:VOC family protein [Tepidiformaceae bacterium]
MTSQPATRAITPLRVQHLVLNVRDMEESHRFYTEVMGFQLVTELDRRPAMHMRFYKGATDNHHDLALSAVRDPSALPDPGEWSMAARQLGLNHMAVQYPDRESWLKQVEHLQQRGVKFHIRGEHGMSHSVYISDPNGYGIEVLYDIPEEMWKDDIDEAFAYFKTLPTEGPGALEDSTEAPALRKG